MRQDDRPMARHYIIRVPGSPHRELIREILVAGGYELIGAYTIINVSEAEPSHRDEHGVEFIVRADAVRGPDVLHPYMARALDLDKLPEAVFFRTEDMTDHYKDEKK